MKSITYPPRVQFAVLPTRIERLQRYSETVGVDVWIKRDDQTGFALSGNKVRKLEFSFARALAEGASGVVTCGGVNSNHCRATAFLAARLGLSCELFLRTPDGNPPSRLEGNTLLDAIAGARFHWIDPAQYQERERLMRDLVTRRALDGERLASFPEGASDALGALGFVNAVEEVQAQLSAKNLDIDAVVHAVGSGGTTAGLAAGRELCGAKWTNLAFAVCDDRAHFTDRVASIVEDMELLGVPVPPVRNLEVVDEYKGEGYGIATQEELRFYADLARSEGILLDPCYSGKAFFGMHREIARGRFRAGSQILFWHTGGGFANFSYGDAWESVLRP